MKQALYRNYRPRSFNELVGQDHVTKTLAQAVKNGRISHAYLFTGPRGVGKTSAARILAHTVNGLPYEDEAQHLDIIEIDAASNRRIDEIRDLREKVRTAPTAGQYKVYIIDEVHMLTREAFNALLKTLEEPPAHAIFVMATTEAHKLPETIISRTQRFEFKPIPEKQMASQLKEIAKTEKIAVSPEALQLIAGFGRGSFRDSISLLDQLSTAGKITEVEVRLSLGLPSEQAISEIITALNAADAGAIITLLQGLKDQGVEPAAASSALAKRLREDIIAKNANAYSAQLLKQLIEVPASSRPYDFLEICLLETANQNGSKAVRETKEASNQDAAPPLTSIKKISRGSKAQPADFDIDQWPLVVRSARQKAASIYTALRLAKPQYDDGVLVLKFQYALHQKKLLQAKNKYLIASLVEELIGSRVKIECIVDKAAFSAAKPAVASKVLRPDTMGSINNIFGAAEVVEA